MSLNSNQRKTDQFVDLLRCHGPYHVEIQIRAKAQLWAHVCTAKGEFHGTVLRIGNVEQLELVGLPAWRSQLTVEIERLDTDSNGQLRAPH